MFYCMLYTFSGQYSSSGIKSVCPNFRQNYRYIWDIKLQGFQVSLIFKKQFSGLFLGYFRAVMSILWGKLWFFSRTVSFCCRCEYDDSALLTQVRTEFWQNQTFSRAQDPISGYFQGWKLNLVILGLFTVFRGVKVRNHAWKIFKLYHIKLYRAVVQSVTSLTWKST